MDRLRLAFGFLMFHRRTILGILLLVGLYYFITEIVPRIAAARRETSFKQPASSPAAQPSDSTKTGALTNANESPQPQGKTSTNGNESANQLLKSENPDVLIKELIRLKTMIQKTSSDAIQLVVSADIIKLSKHLLELPIDLNQRKFALGSLAESLLLMRLIKINSNLADESIDEAFLEKTKELLADRDPVIRSFAALTIVTSAVFDFHAHPTDDRLATLEKSIDENFDAIAIDHSQLKRFTEIMLRSDLPVSDQPQAKALLNRYGQRLHEHQEPEVNEIGRAFTENLTFRKLEIENLVFYLGERSAASDLKADAFFAALETFPEASIPIYQISMDVIREYMMQKRQDRADQLVEKMEKDILPKRKDSEIKTRIQKALDELKAGNQYLNQDRRLP